MKKISLQQLAKEEGLTVRTLYTHIKLGYLQTERPGGHVHRVNTYQRSAWSQAIKKKSTE
ncbi:MAG: hypothetical protein V7776_21775 [Halopseudomonas aestusnigri]